MYGDESYCQSIEFILTKLNFKNREDIIYECAKQS